MVKKVIYFEKERFLRSMLENALKTKNAQIFTFPCLKDHFFQIEDIKPDLIIFSLDDDASDLERLYTYADYFRLIASGTEEQKIHLDKRIHGYLSKPILAHTLSERILALID